ncbi:MAG: MBL fold metallo-hydrolase [Deltaproteobacteria bacterium]|nr:MBL fold metallo-hydrolase [Deltaproteobacteria bacterium]
MIEALLKKIHWLGHDGFRIDASKVIYLDPYQITSTVPADIILVSHDHFDHCSPEDIHKIQKKDTVIITDRASAGKLKGDVRIVKPGDRFAVQGVEVEIVPAYNTNKQFHPKADGKLGFIITIDGARVYHAGDTDFIPEMKNSRADIALLPVSGTYVMTADEAAEAALAIHPKYAIPMHYGAIVGSAADAQAFADKLKGKVDVKILPRE